MQTNTENLSSIEIANTLYEHGRTPLALIPFTKRPMGRDGKGSDWSNISYSSLQDMQPHFQDPEHGIGLLLGVNDIVLDIDDENIANHYTYTILQALKIPTSINVIGRQKKAVGAILYQTDENPKHYEIKDNSGKVLVELLVKGAQKVLPPSQFKNPDGTLDQFEWRKKFTPDFQFVSYAELKEAANHVAIFSMLDKAYPAEGKRDKACHCLARVFKSAARSNKINAEYATHFIQLLSMKNHDRERLEKEWDNTYTKANKITNAQGQLLKHFAKLEEKDAAKIAELLGYNKEEEEVISEDWVQEELYAATAASSISEAAAVGRDWLIKGLIERGTYSQVHGTGGSGKSLMSIQLAVLATNPNSYFCDLFDFHKPLKVAVFNNEDSQDELDRRLLLVLKGLRERDANNKNIKFNLDNIILKSWLKKPLKFLDKNERTGKLTIRAKTIKLVQQWLKDNEIDLLILDPIIAFHNAEENSNNDMDMFIRECVIAPFSAQCNIGVLGIHHVAKGTSNNDSDIEGNTNASRGASALTNAARVVLRLAGMNFKTAQTIWPNWKENKEILDQRHDYTQLAYGKVNNTRATEGNWLRKLEVKFRNQNEEIIDGVFLMRDPNIENIAKDAEKQKKQEKDKQRRIIIDTLFQSGFIPDDENDNHYGLMDVARALVEYNDDFIKEISAEDVKGKTGAEDYRKSDKAVANIVQKLFQSVYKHKERDFIFENKKRGSGVSCRWLLMKPEEIEHDTKSKAIDFEEDGDDGL